MNIALSDTSEPVASKPGRSDSKPREQCASRRVDPVGAAVAVRAGQHDHLESDRNVLVATVTDIAVRELSAST
jgi:hypothetical protein